VVPRQLPTLIILFVGMLRISKDCEENFENVLKSFYFSTWKLLKLINYSMDMC
jgi:hypothetical protein